jgi:hypothetical protein
MFSAAVEIARTYTAPYVGLRRKHDGAVFSTVAAFVVVNESGWAITAKHVFDEVANAARSIGSVQQYDADLAALRSQKGGDAKHRNREIGRLESLKRDSLSHHVEIWAAGADVVSAKPQPVEVHLHPTTDLAAFRLDPFAPARDQQYPILRADPFTPGLSVCRMGFPWHQVLAEFADNNFEVKSGFPAPLFVSEGMVSRFIVFEHPDGGRDRLIQTSSPGLRGQSGGPLFGVDGRVCGLQSSTTHLDLGFDARYERDGREIVERQFLNVGQAVHVDDIRDFLDSLGVRYASA